MAGGSKINQSGSLVAESLHHHRPFQYHSSKHYINRTEEVYNCLRQTKLLQKDISRVLYTNLEVSRQEEFLLLFVLTGTSIFVTDNSCKSKNSHNSKNCNPDGEYFDNVNSSITSPDMADSGLESLFSPHETSPSETSGTDLEESNNVSINEDSALSSTCNGRSDQKINTDYNQTPTEDSSQSYDKKIHKTNVGSIETVNQEISDYENQVLSDPFCESDGESDENEHRFMTKNNTKTKFNNDKHDQENECLNDPNQLRYTNHYKQAAYQPKVVVPEVKNYYFIDASSLNDDIDDISPNYNKNDIARMFPKCPVQVNINNTKSECMLGHSVLNNDLKASVNGDCIGEYHGTNTTNSPLMMKVNVDSSVENQEMQISNNTHKEALVVEIKEADSEESAQHSPCPDGAGNRQKINSTSEHSDNDINNVHNFCPHSVVDGNESSCSKESENGKNEGGDKRRNLIRRNTFELEADDEKLTALRQEYERRQGSQNSGNQNSQKPDGEFYLDSAIQSGSVTTEDNLSNVTSDTEMSSGTKYSSNFGSSGKYNSDVAEKEVTNNPHFNPDMYSESRDEIQSVARSSSDKNLAIHDDYSADDLEENSCISLPINLNNSYNGNPRNSQKYWRGEAVPIVSGGSSVSDFTKPPESPMIKRRTETTPIVSGGSVIIPETKVRERPKPLKLSSATTAWIVDMSDCNAAQKKEKESPKKAIPSLPLGAGNNQRKFKDKLTPEKRCDGIGYFVKLDELKSPKEKPKNDVQIHRRHQSFSKQSCEFFVDLSDKSNKPSESSKLESKIPIKREAKSTNEMDKKNMFSMFIDLNDVPTKGIEKSSSSSKLAEKRLELQNRLSHSSSEVKGDVDIDQKKEKPKSGVFMFIESDSPVVRRRTMSSSRPPFKRHSWNTDKSNESSTTEIESIDKEPVKSKLEHKRAHSLSVERSSSDFRKFLGMKSSQSMLTQQKFHKPKDDGNDEDSVTMDDITDYDIRDTPPNSHVEIINEEILLSAKKQNYQELIPPEEKSNIIEDDFSEASASIKATAESPEAQTRKSETFNISTSSTAVSSGSDNSEFKISDLVFDQRTQLNNSIQTNEKIIETQKSLNEKIKIMENELKDATSSNSNILKVRLGTMHIKNSAPRYVKLSDLNKPRVISRSSSSSSTKEDNVQKNTLNTKKTYSKESTVITSGNKGLKNTTAKRFPSTMTSSLPSRIRPDGVEELAMEGDMEGVISESDISSLHSSMGRSGAECSTEETETSTSFAIGKPYNRLGEDLLRMFLEGINTDVTLEVNGQKIRAHKCILSSRCQYFAAILSGGWIENAGNVISLQGYSYNSVHFSLCHIYSGESYIPDTIDIVELASLADMLCLEGLKEVIGFTLKVKFCHLFHKPCNVCTVGVIGCLPLAAACGLDEVYRKSLKWIMKYFVRIWPSKEFATLPRELMDKCYHQHIIYMSTDNVLQTIMDCDKLLATLPNVRWAEPVFQLGSNLLDASMKYLTENLASVLMSEQFLNIGHEQTWNISRLEDHLLAASDRLLPEQACKSYSRLHKMLNTVDGDLFRKIRGSTLLTESLNKIYGRVEKCLIREAARAARTTAWSKMDLDLRRRIQELACLVIVPNESNKRPSRHSNFHKDTKELLESKITPERATINRNLDLLKVKMAISEHTERPNNKPTPLLQTRKVMNKPKSDPPERKPIHEKSSSKSSIDNIFRPKSWPNKTEVKSRYLEPRTRPAPKDSPSQDKVIVHQRKKIMISSSDSSRTSSPAMKRAVEKRPIIRTKLSIKKDCKALSSDSLSDNLAAKMMNKKEPISKSLGITRPESPTIKQKSNSLTSDSLTDSRKKTTSLKASKLDNSVSVDSICSETRSITPKPTLSKQSPSLGRIGINRNQSLIQDKLKKPSPPTQIRNLQSAVRRPTRSLESSTAASRSRAAAALSIYHPTTPSLRKNLLEAAKTPDIPNKFVSNSFTQRSSFRQSPQSNRSANRNEKRDNSSNLHNSGSPSKRSPKNNDIGRLKKPTNIGSKPKTTKPEETVTVKPETPPYDASKFIGQRSRSNTFSKDEPTILKKSDIAANEIDF